MKFCSACGSADIALTIPEGDQRARYVCPACGTVHYSNPKVVCGVVPVFEDKVMLCLRGIEPRLGKWTLPAGFMENNETVEEGAERELFEEAVATVTLRAFADGALRSLHLAGSHDVSRHHERGEICHHAGKYRNSAVSRRGDSVERTRISHRQNSA